MKCRVSGLTPDAAVVVATVRALKAHSGRHTMKPGAVPARAAGREPRRGRAGAQPRKHLEILKKFGVSPVVAINAFPTDHPSEHEVIQRDRRGRRCPISGGQHVVDGGPVRSTLPSRRRGRQRAERLPFLYPLEPPSTRRSSTIATSLYGATGVTSRRLLRPNRPALPRVSATATSDRHREDALVHH